MWLAPYLVIDACMAVPMSCDIYASIVLGL